MNRGDYHTEIRNNRLLQLCVFKGEPSPMLAATVTETQKDPDRQSSDTLHRDFLGKNIDYYQQRFQQLDAGVAFYTLPNPIVACLGPLWAAGRGVWLQFWLALGGETLAVVYLVKSFTHVESGVDSRLLAISVAGLVGLRLVQMSTANWVLWKAFARWRHGRGAPGRPYSPRAVAGLALVGAFFSIAIVRYGLSASPKFLEKFPAPRTIQRTSAKTIDKGVDWMVVNFEAFFDSVTVGLRETLNLLESVFVGIPWPLMVIMVTLAAWRTAGWRIGLFSIFALVYLGLFGYWEKSMSTMSLVAASALLCIVVGTPLGIWCGKNPRVYRFVRPVLDFMQTMPSFVYLIPAVAFFSIGKPPGVFATVIFAMPPMIRLTALGIQQVPHDVKEAALAFGASPWKLLMKVELPLAVPSLMTGANQTIMMSLSMVIVASMIGAGGLGYDVLKAAASAEHRRRYVGRNRHRVLRHGARPNHSRRRRPRRQVRIIYL